MMSRCLNINNNFSNTSTHSTSSIYVEEMKDVMLNDFTTWRVPNRLDFSRTVGSGAYGIVADFYDNKLKKNIAVKKIGDAFKDPLDARRILREIRILKHFNHPNIIQIMEIFPPDNPDFNDIYIASELMKADLHQIIQSKQNINEKQLSFLVYQILRGLYYLNSANVLHRDLKPCNILVNLDCTLKICDFGLARAFTSPQVKSGSAMGRTQSILGDSTEKNAAQSCSKTIRKFPYSNLDQDASELTEYVVTRWYRSPELILTPQHYGKSVDIWSLGCILAEILGQRTLFAGEDNFDQLKRIVKVIGTPTPDDLAWLPCGPSRDKALKNLASMQRLQGEQLESLFPKASPASLDLLEKMLKFNPEERITVEDALKHDFVKDLHLNFDEPICDKAIDWSFDKVQLKERELKNRIYEEILDFNPGMAVRDEKKIKTYGIRVKCKR